VVFLILFKTNHVQNHKSTLFLSIFSLIAHYQSDTVHQQKSLREWVEAELFIVLSILNKVFFFFLKIKTFNLKKLMMLKKYFFLLLWMLYSCSKLLLIIFYLFIYACLYLFILWKPWNLFFFSEFFHKKKVKRTTFLWNGNL